MRDMLEQAMGGVFVGVDWREENGDRLEVQLKGHLTRLMTSGRGSDGRRSEG